MKIHFIACCLALALSSLGAGVVAEDRPEVVASDRIVIRGRPAVTVTTNEIRLSDVADITSTGSRHDDAIIALQKLIIQESPRPGHALTLNAEQVVVALKNNGVDLTKVAYILPRTFEVQRASRTINESEIRSAIERYLGSSGREVTLKHLTYPQDLQIAPDSIEFSARELTSTSPGHIGFTVSVDGPNQSPTQFDVTAAIDEWREVPVLKRNLTRGSVIGNEDVGLARLNLGALPKDFASDEQQVIGLQLDREMSVGEVFQRSKLAVPAVIEAGSRVTLIYRRGPLEATATGEALESRGMAEQIRVRNINSKRVVSGSVVERGLVEVKP